MKIHFCVHRGFIVSKIDDHMAILQPRLFLVDIKFLFVLFFRSVRVDFENCMRVYLATSRVKFLVLSVCLDLTGGCNFKETVSVLLTRKFI